MHCQDGRSLEVSVVVSVAPGPLSQFTKIVRIIPRYVIVNSLEYPIRLWQENSLFLSHPSDTVTVGKRLDESKWILQDEENPSVESFDRVNQYEALWGRQTILDQGCALSGLGTTASRSSLYITTIGPKEALPFSLPDSRADRFLRLDVGDRYNLTSSFEADRPGEISLKLTPAVDLRLLRHVSTRAAPEYEIIIPRPGDSGPVSELGIWFETEWGTDHSILVKTVKKDSYAYEQTDIRPGDELLSIDGILVSEMSFSESMKMLRDRLGELKTMNAQSTCRDSSRPGAVKRLRRASIQFLARQKSSEELKNGPPTTVSPLRLEFRTLEEKLKRVRLRAARGGRKSRRNEHQLSSAETRNGITFQTGSFSPFLKVDIRTIDSNRVIVLRESGRIPYHIHNRSLSCTLYFRQRGCTRHPWNILKPGQSTPYTWEEPMKAKKLTVRVSVEATFAAELGEENEEGEFKTEFENKEDGFVKRNLLKVRKVKDEEVNIFSHSVNVLLEEIGFRDLLLYKVRSGDSLQPRHLELEVDVFKGSRVLVIQDPSSEEDDLLLDRQLQILNRKFEEETVRYNALVDLQSRLVSRYGGMGDGAEGSSSDSICDDANKVMYDFPEEARISKKHQLVVQVVEALGLNPGSFVGNCNPYVEVSLKQGGHKKRLFLPPKVVHRTYYIKKSFNPKWESQTFCFDVPQEAVSDSRGYAVIAKLKNFRQVGMDQDLGRAIIELHSLRDQKPLSGWFPLSPKSGQHDLEVDTKYGRGSVYVKMHWVYTVPSLLQYYTLLSERRLSELRDSVGGMTEQRKSKREMEELRREGNDGFGLVRVDDIFPKSKSHRTKLNSDKVIKKENSQRTRSQTSSLRDSGLVRKLLNSAVYGGAEKAMRRSRNSVRSPLIRNEAMPFLLKEENPSFEGRIATPEQSFMTRKTKAPPRIASTLSSSDLEDKIATQRKAHMKDLSSFREYTESSGGRHFSDRMPLDSFSSWNTLQVLINDTDIQVNVDRDIVHLSLRRSHLLPGIISQQKSIEDGSDVLKKICPPRSTPSVIFQSILEHAQNFEKSRLAFETFAKCSLMSALNPGGLFTVRPIKALNLPENFAHMLVRGKYGNAVISTGSVDARVSPRWVDDRSFGKERSAHDLNFFIAPQVSSGNISLSVIGEKVQNRIKTRTEIGVLEIPLGGAITSCLFDERSQSSKTYSYRRWFPLNDPSSLIPCEGDRALNFRPIDTEQTRDDLFNEYFAPCIELELLWSPESDENLNETNGSSMESNPERGGSLRFVKNYLTCNISSVSFALIDSQRGRELLSISLQDISTRYWETHAKSRFGFAAGSIQIDQQDNSAREPVILAATPRENMVTVLQVLAVKDNIRSKSNVLSFEFIDVQIAEVDLTVEEKFLFDIFEFVSAVKLRRNLHRNVSQGGETTPTLQIQSSAFESYNDTTTTTLYENLFYNDKKDDAISTRLYAEQVVLGALRVNLSYLKGKKQSTLLERLSDDVQYFRFHHEKSDIFFSWSQRTFDEDRLAEVESK